jgi:hypothetical protein
MEGGGFEVARIEGVRRATLWGSVQTGRQRGCGFRYDGRRFVCAEGALLQATDRKNEREGGRSGALVRGRWCWIQDADSQDRGEDGLRSSTRTGVGLRACDGLPTDCGHANSIASPSGRVQF